MKFFNEVQGWLYGGARAELRGLATDFDVVKLFAAMAGTPRISTCTLVDGPLYAVGLPGTLSAAEPLVVQLLIRAILAKNEQHIVHLST